jgi:hypothetical protein
MDFANGKTIDSRFTFSRSSTGTYVGADGLIKTAYVDVPRFDHDPSTGESLGLLIETSRTNNIYNSNLSTGWSIASGDTFNLVPGVTNPDGTSARGYLLGTTNIHHRLYRTVTLSTNTVHTFSCFFKRAGGTYNRYVEIEVSGYFDRYQAVTFDLQDMVYNHTGTDATQIFMEDYGDGWIRCGFSANPGTIALGHIWFGFPTNTSSDHAMVGDNTIGLYMWGAQIEVDNFHTSYIPTQSTSVTRATDYATANYTDIPVKSNVSETTVVADGRIAWSDDHGTNYYVWSANSEAGDSKYHGVRIDGASGTFLYQTNNGSGYPGAGGGSNLGTPNQTFDFKTATTLKDGELIAYFNKLNGPVWTGIAGQSNTGGVIPPDSLEVFHLGGAGQHARRTWLKKIAIYEKFYDTLTLKTLVDY